MLALWVLAALQSGPAPDVTARVDRSHVTAGDDLLLTIRARTRSAAPVTLALPALTGFTVVGSREVTEVTLEALGGPVRITTRELELRAQRPGALVIGPVRVEQGGRRVTTAALTVTVDSARAGLATAVSPIARRLIAAATPPTHDEKGDHVGLSVLLPGDSVPFSLPWPDRLQAGTYRLCVGWGQGTPADPTTCAYARDWPCRPCREPCARLPRHASPP